MTGNPEKPLGVKGMKTVRRTLADGSVKEYRYRRRLGQPRPADGILRRIFNEYSASPEFNRAVSEWRQRKLWLFKLIEERLGWMTERDLNSRIARTKFYELRDAHRELPDRADKMMQALCSALEWAYDRGMIDVNHARRIGMLAVRNQPKHYTQEQEDLILAKVPDDLRTLYLFALYTGLRRGDICRLKRSDLKDGWLSVQPHKTSRTTRVWVHLPTYALPPLKALIAELPKTGDALLTTAAGVPWTEYNISHRWRRAMLKIGIEGTWFNEIRHTTATRLVEAGCTDAERGAIMGHAVSQGAGAAYVARTKALSVNAYTRWAKALEGGEVVYMEQERWRSQR
jgi:integrase